MPGIVDQYPADRGRLEQGIPFVPVGADADRPPVGLAPAVLAKVDRRALVRRAGRHQATSASAPLDDSCSRSRTDARSASAVMNRALPSLTDRRRPDLMRAKTQVRHMPSTWAASAGRYRLMTGSEFGLSQ